MWDLKWQTQNYRNLLFESIVIESLLCWWCCYQFPRIKVKTFCAILPNSNILPKHTYITLHKNALHDFSFKLNHFTTIQFFQSLQWNRFQYPKRQNFKCTAQVFSKICLDFSRLCYKIFEDPQNYHIFKFLWKLHEVLQQSHIAGFCKGIIVGFITRVSRFCLSLQISSNILINTQ